jgi:hypothetical protein
LRRCETLRERSASGDPIHGTNGLHRAIERPAL